MTAKQKISEAIDVHVLPDLHLQALWALDSLSNGSEDRFPAVRVATYLVENCHVSTYRQAITKALEKGKGHCHKNGKGYKLMEPGRKALEATITNRVVFIESGKPFSAKNVLLKELFSKLRNQILICDPYLDVSSLDVLFRHVDKATPVRVLTRNIADKPAGTFQRHLTELRREGFRVEVGQHSASELHDRYVMDDTMFWLSGNSFNHLGSKESFLVALGDDVRASMTALFEKRWSAATKL